MATVMVLLADGFEEIETVSVIGILRRAKLKVVVAGVTGLDVTSARGINMVADTLLEDEIASAVDMVVLPGGEPGCTNLQRSAIVHDYLHDAHARGIWIAAICSAPRVLAAFKLIHGKQVTGFPTIEPLLADSTYVSKDVVVDAPFITSRGPGTAMKFAFEMVAVLQNRQVVKALKSAMLVR